jgi:hypothetical protein
MTPKAQPGKKKPPKSAPGPVRIAKNKVPLPEPAPKNPGLITSFMNMVDIAEAIKQAEAASADAPQDAEKK